MKKEFFPLNNASYDDDADAYTYEMCVQKKKLFVLDHKSWVQKMQQTIIL